jgi:ATP-dependent helicase/nuclease subunit A
VWVFGSKENRSASQSALLEQESQLDANEDRNLLYVAATRAKEVLVLSGVEPSRGNSGTSWYARCAPYARLIETQGASLPVDAGGGDSGRGGFPPPSGQGEDERPQMVWIADFRPVPFPTGQRAGVPELADEWSDTARRRGIALHRVLEAAAGALPDPDRARAIARSEGLTASLGEEVARLAMRILSEPALRRFFDPGLYRRAFSEIELITPEGALLRMDRLVEFDNEVWVLDYKSSASSAGLAPHRSQLEIYRAALEARKYGRPVRAGIIFADAVLIEL